MHVPRGRRRVFDDLQVLEVHVVDVRTAEALKYACNAFHATKVSFTNELSRLFRLLRVSVTGILQFAIAHTSWIGLVRIVSIFGSAAAAGWGWEGDDSCSGSIRKRLS